MTAVCVIPARGGSVRIPRKNIREFRGVPMVVRAVRLARQSNLFDRVIVSTDDDEIDRVCPGATWVYRRPPDDGTRGTEDVVCEALADSKLVNCDVCTIYPCSPLLDEALLYRGWLLFREYGVQVASTYSGRPLDAGNLYWQHARQLRAGQRVWKDPTMCMPLPPERCIDINTEADWQQAEAMFDALHQRT